MKYYWWILVQSFTKYLQNKFDRDWNLKINATAKDSELKQYPGVGRECIEMNVRSTWWE